MSVYNLLYTECGRALLDIIGTGVDVVEATLASQGRLVWLFINISSFVQVFVCCFINRQKSMLSS